MTSQIPENSTPACDQLRSGPVQYSCVFDASRLGNTCQRGATGVSHSVRGPGNGRSMPKWSPRSQATLDLSTRIRRGSSPARPLRAMLQAKCRTVCYSSTPRVETRPACWQVRGSAEHYSRNNLNVSAIDFVLYRHIYDGNGVSFCSGRCVPSPIIHMRGMPSKACQLVNEVAHSLVEDRIILHHCATQGVSQHPVTPSPSDA